MSYEGLENRTKTQTLHPELRSRELQYAVVLVHQELSGAVPQLYRVSGFTSRAHLFLEGSLETLTFHAANT